MAKAIVTGGAGFIGSHLCERLLQEGYEVACIDDVSTGSRDNVRHLEDEAGFIFLQADVRQAVEWPDGVDLIFHLASPASPPAFYRLPVETATANSHGAYEMLKLAERSGARFLLASTSEVYGEPLFHPQREDHWGNVNPVGPRACYDEGKRFAEALTTAYQESRGVDVRIVRIFNTYGPRSQPEDGRMVPNFAQQALAGAPITVYGDGSQTRSLCYVDDLVDGLILAMLRPQAQGEVINLGCPDERSVMEFAAMIRDICGSASEIEYLPARDEEPTRRCPDIDKAHRLLGWQPVTDLRSGLEATVSWFRAQLPAEPAAATIQGKGLP